MSAIRDSGSLQRLFLCLDKYRIHEFGTDEIYCNATYDGFLCWPPTTAGTTTSQNCPRARFSDPTRMAKRTCGMDGIWKSRRANETSKAGWTNFTACFPTEMRNLLTKVYDNDTQEKFDIAIHTRTLEIIGFSISLVALVISLFIFSNYRSLRNSRTRIHKSLFYAMVLQVVIRLTIYIDQALIRYKIQDNPAYENVTVHGIDNMPYLCESSYILLEYAITVMFMWMFIEGIYLHSMVAGNSLRERISHVVYYATGWGLPVIITAAWATVTSIHYKSQSAEQCWYGYNFSPYYWIVESPRLAVIVINFLFLLNIIRVLVVKLSKNDTTEIVIVRKAVRAALVLLPLLGITNVLNMIEAPIDSEVWKFAVWIYTTHFLRSFQGFFISLIYCFLNGEVRMVIVKQYNNRKTIAENERRRRNRFLQDMSPQQQQRGRRRQREQLPSTFIPMTTLRRHRPHSASDADRCHIDTELGSSYLRTHRERLNTPTLRCHRPHSALGTDRCYFDTDLRSSHMFTS